VGFRIPFIEKRMQNEYRNGGAKQRTDDVIRGRERVLSSPRRRFRQSLARDLDKPRLLIKPYRNRFRKRALAFDD
jgi:hypothetical protein